MKFILGGINGNYLRFYTDNGAEKTDEVLAAVAYATDSNLLFDWCERNDIPLKFYGRLSDDISVATPILKNFLAKRSLNFSCKLVQYHHAKVIWWRGMGVYIGSANLTNSAWVKNVEAGCFFQDEELNEEHIRDLQNMFEILEENSTSLTEELLRLMIKRSESNNSTGFWKDSSLKTWSGLVSSNPESVESREKERFLDEWRSTLQILRDIGSQASGKFRGLCI